MTYSAPRTAMQRCESVCYCVRVCDRVLDCVRVPLINVSLIPYHPSVSTDGDDDVIIPYSRQAFIKSIPKYGF